MHASASWQEAAVRPEFPQMSSATKALTAHEVLQVLQGDTDALLLCMAWSQTPQGHRHWSDRHSGAVPLSEEDMAFLQEYYDWLVGST
jgi:hypothetical protein